MRERETYRHTISGQVDKHGQPASSVTDRITIQIDLPMNCSISLPSIHRASFWMPITGLACNSNNDDDDNNNSEQQEDRSRRSALVRCPTLIVFSLIRRPSDLWTYFSKQRQHLSSVQRPSLPPTTSQTSNNLLSFLSLSRALSHSDGVLGRFSGLCRFRSVLASRQPSRDVLCWWRARGHVTRGKFPVRCPDAS